MPIGAIGAAIGGVTSLIGGAITSKGAKKAATAQVNANNAAIVSQKEMLDKQLALQEPFRQGGLAANNQMLTLLGLQGGDASSNQFGSAAKPFGASDFQTDPGYQFRLDQGQQALERSAAARGGLLSGSALKATADYSQGLASQEYQNAFNRFQTERQAQLAPLQSMLGVGQGAVNQMGAAIGNTSNAIAGNITGAGEAKASGYVGSANAWSNALSQAVGQGTSYINNGQQQNFMRSLFGK